jgi:hypothetical protein
MTADVLAATVAGSYEHVAIKLLKVSMVLDLDRFDTFDVLDVISEIPLIDVGSASSGLLEVACGRSSAGTEPSRKNGKSPPMRPMQLS